MRLPFATAALAFAGAFLTRTAPTDTYPQDPDIDALNYAFTLELSDTTDLSVG